MSSLLLFVNIQSPLMARRWNRLWDNSLQFNRGKKAAIMQKCKYEYLHIVWTICALMASIMTLVFRRLWNDIRTVLICWCALWDSRAPPDRRNPWILGLPWASLFEACRPQEESCSHQTLRIFITTHSCGTFWRPQTSVAWTSPILVKSHMFVVTSAGSELILWPLLQASFGSLQLQCH